MGSRVELFASIRRDARVEGTSIRELARKHHVARKTVRKALISPLPPERKTPERSSPRLDPFNAAIDAMLIEDTAAPRKQRHGPKGPGPADRGIWRAGAVVFDRARLCAGPPGPHRC
jgi:hypothetical protein